MITKAVAHVTWHEDMQIQTDGKEGTDLSQDHFSVVELDSALVLKTLDAITNLNAGKKR